MIGFLKGTVLRSNPERVLLDVGGVGYEVQVPLSTYYEIERHGAGRPVALFIHTYLRDDGIALFGFWSEREKALFEKLITVSGVGPRLARAVLSGLSADDLVAALAAADVARLSSVPGVGKKTAERLALELRDKVRDLAAELPARPALADEDLISALVNLGYKRAHAERAARQARQDHPEAQFHDLLRASLRQLSRV